MDIESTLGHTTMISMYYQCDQYNYGKALNLVVVGSSPTVGDFPSVAAAARPFVAQRAGNAKPPQRRKQTPACLHAPCVGGALSPLHVMLLVMLQQASSVSSSSKFGRGAIAMHVWHLPFMA